MFQIYPIYSIYAIDRGGNTNSRGAAKVVLLDKTLNEPWAL